MASGSVKAEGMSVTAQAESGILIKEHGNADAPFGTVATISGNAAKLYPASTADLATWYHSNSTQADQAQGGTNNTQGYKDITRETDIGSYRYVKSFAIRSATDSPITSSKLKIKDLVVSVAGNSTVSLNNSIRIGLKLSSGGADNAPFFIYAPKTDDLTEDSTDTANYFKLNTTYVSGGAKSELKEYTAVKDTDFLLLNGDKIPADDTSLVVDVFIWYEGEDKNCMTNNIISSNSTVLTPDTLSVSISFERVSA